MIVRLIAFKRAVSVLLAGTALFLLGCQAKTPVVPKVEPGRDLFATAERHWEKRDLDRALSAYERFINTAPGDSRVPQAIHRIAEISLEKGDPDKALTFLLRLTREYPQYTWIPEVSFQIAVLRFEQGDYEASLSDALKWLSGYSNHFLKRDVLVLLGDDFCALGEAQAAVFCWTEARELWGDNPEKVAQIRERLHHLMAQSGPVVLEELLKSGLEFEDSAAIYHQLALDFLERKQFDQAEKAARALLETSGTPQWAAAAETLLDRIKKATSIHENRIGCLLPLSGPFSIYGQEVLNGISLGLIDSDNEHLSMEVLVRDTAGETEKAVKALDELVKDERVLGVIGPLSSKIALSVAEEAQELGIPVIALTQKQGIVDTGDMVFRNFLTPKQEIDRLLQLAMGEMGLKNFAILYPDNAYGRFCMNLFWDQLDEMGGSVTAVESYPTNITDFADQIKKMVGLYDPRNLAWRRLAQQRNSVWDEESTIELEEDEPYIDFDAVFIPDTFERVAMIAPQLVFHDVVGVRLLGTRTWHSPRLMDLAKDYLQGAVFSTGFLPESRAPEVAAFVTAYRENFGVLPGILAASGYDTIKLLGQIVQSARPQTHEALREALLGLEIFEGVTGPITFDEQGDAQKVPVLLTVSGKNLAPIP